MAFTPTSPTVSTLTCCCALSLATGSGRISTRQPQPRSPAPTSLDSRKRWIGYALKTRGEIVVNDGAKAALTTQGKSLLPAGVVRVSGDFRFGDPVACVDLAAQRFAQGLVNYSAAELQAI